MRDSVLFCNHLSVMGYALFHQLNKQLQAYTHAHFGMQSMLVVYTVLPVCLGPIALLHHPIRCKRDTTGRGCDGLGGKRWGSSLVPWLIPNEMQIHSPSVCWVPLFFWSSRPFPFAVFWFHALSLLLERALFSIFNKHERHLSLCLISVVVLLLLAILARTENIVLYR